MRRICSLSLLLALLLVPYKSQLHKSYLFNYRMRTIVIDAGHGGHDAGCHGTSAYEKNVTLAVALKLGALIEKNIPGTKVVYTRKTDVFIELNERANIANKNNADLFISIHCNANKNTSAYGTESWTMGLHKTEGNLEVAKRENSSILYEKDYMEKYDGFDPNSPEAYIVFSLNQNAFINQSLLLASKVEDEFQKDNRTSRGVKQAGFLVLWRTVMPSILIETGFLTNRNEEKYLASESGQNETAKSILDAVLHYKSKMENSVNGMFNENDRTLTGNDSTKENSLLTKQVVEAEAKDSVVKPVTQNVVTNPITGTTYRVQLAASTKSIDVKAAPYSSLRSIVCVNEDAVYRVMTLHYRTLDEAKKAKTDFRQKGFKDAFIVEYYGNKRGKTVEN